MHNYILLYTLLHVQLNFDVVLFSVKDVVVVVFEINYFSLIRHTMLFQATVTDIKLRLLTRYFFSLQIVKDLPLIVIIIDNK